jgi:hypothetical protein
VKYEQTRDENGKPVVKVDGVVQEVDVAGFPIEDYLFVMVGTVGFDEDGNPDLRIEDN